MAASPIETTEPATSIEADFHQWALETATAIEGRQFHCVDWDNVAEELRGLSRSEERELESRLSQLMYHLLKWQYQPERRSRSWQLSRVDQSRRISALLAKQPSLRALLTDSEFWNSAYQGALGLSGNENLPDSVTEQFPDECPFGDEILD